MTEDMIPASPGRLKYMLRELYPEVNAADAAFSRICTALQSAAAPAQAAALEVLAEDARRAKTELFQMLEAAERAFDVYEKCETQISDLLYGTCLAGE